MDESMQDSFKQTKDLIVVDKIKIFPRQIRRGKTLLQSTTFFKGEGMESIKIYSQKDCQAIQMYNLRETSERNVEKEEKKRRANPDHSRGDDLTHVKF